MVPDSSCLVVDSTRCRVCRLDAARSSCVFEASNADDGARAALTQRTFYDTVASWIYVVYLTHCHLCLYRTLHPCISCPPLHVEPLPWSESRFEAAGCGIGEANLSRLASRVRQHQLWRKRDPPEQASGWVINAWMTGAQRVSQISDDNDGAPLKASR